MNIFERPLVSVIIPTYNREALIKRAVYSVLSQTYKNIEIIIIDDCSSDDTLSILKKIDDKRIKIFKNDKNMGANYCRNRGIKISKGEYIAFQDSDDEWKERKIECCLNELIRQNADIVFHGMIKMGRGYRRYLPTYNINKYEDKYKKLLYRNCVSTQNIIGKRGCFLRYSFDERQRKMQDWEWILRVAKEGYKIFYIESALTIAYIQEDSITLKPFDYESLLRIYNKHKEYITSNKDLNSKFLLDISINCIDKSQSLSYARSAWKIKKSLRALKYYFIVFLGLRNFLKKVNIYVRKIFTKFRIWNLIDKFHNVG